MWRRENGGEIMAKYQWLKAAAMAGVSMSAVS